MKFKDMTKDQMKKKLAKANKDIVESEAAENNFRQKEQALLSAAADWGKTFDSITDFVSLHDEDLKFIKVNKALADFVGITPKELIGKHCYEIIHGIGKPFPGCPHIEMMKTKETVTKEIFEPALGLHLMVTVSPLLDESVKLIGSIHIVKNITERKQAEAEREKLILELREALDKVKTLSGMLPICASCNKIRDDKGYWNQVLDYIIKHTDVEFTHGYCPECAKKLYPRYYKEED